MVVHKLLHSVSAIFTAHDGTSSSRVCFNRLKRIMVLENIHTGRPSSADTFGSSHAEVINPNRIGNKFFTCVAAAATVVISRFVDIGGLILAICLF